ncbi:aldehyde/histidinol dehydrogenase [Nitzschia inconspicua]|uniref:Aldehyde dehydrogenase n=1 Tax=Nitzschia inconspicua TaxID=303405 RepID=A0A9K3K6L3_9STRA|nr:aldehyde dehydrogenase [Nitzschia inconspicua]KAG7362670.1 aldehyde/histidinol dehydrogenase [Nitzschia inconspicua]
MTDEIMDFDRLVRVSSKRKEWGTLPLEDKLSLLEEIFKCMTQELSYEDYKENGKEGAAVMGFDVSTAEGNYEAEQLTLGWFFLFLKQVKDTIFAYKVLTGKEKPPKMLTKGNLKTRRAVNGQIVLETFPSFPSDTSGFSFLSGTKGEVWMDPEKITDESQIEIFNKEKAWEDAAGEEGGLMVVLGAGNQVGLTPVDILQGLFRCNCVVYLKQHPLRDYCNMLLAKIFAPVIAKGYLDIEAHTSNERVAALIHHPQVTAVHLTGGKKTHDLLVFGSDPKEREKNMKAKTPKLKAKMTSELGAVSPWIIVPGKYTKEELENQAKYLAFTVHSNASCNCNSPKMICVAEEWDQKEQFLNAVEQSLANHTLPAAYYPGIEERWNNFAKEYPDAKKIESTTGLGIEERHLSAPKFANKPLLLPFLEISVDVDLDSPSGQAKASKEYAFKNEPFAPVYSIATVKGTSQNDLAAFAEKTAVFCNDYLYGTLSGTLTCPPSLLDDVAVQRLVAELKYGSLGINTWGGAGYVAQSTGMWGAFPGESLEAVQSGIGKIGNMMAVPYFQKFVFTGPITSPTNASLKDDFKKEQKLYEAINKLQLDGSMTNFIKLLSVVTGVNLVNAAMAGMSVLVAGVAYIVMRRR